MKYELLIMIYFVPLQKHQTIKSYYHIMKKKIKFSLVYRDMWQSSGKFQPRKDQLERIAPVIIDM